MNNVRKHILGGLWGAMVGDALGVPVEFKDRAERRADPVRDMREYGTHRQPKGTWSDDGSLILCTTDSLIRHEFDTDDLGQRFVAWYKEGLWTPHGELFDIGVTTSQALARIATGMRAEVAGGDGQYSNGNGSLMRIIPVALRFASAPIRQLLDRVHRVSAITHRHSRSQMACGLYSLVIRGLLAGLSAKEAFANGLEAFRSFYESDLNWAVELDYFQLLLTGRLSECREAEIDSSGYVIHTLTASLWCLLTTDTFEECVLKAVNLGGDTDTTGCVAGGLAGVLFGFENIPSRWCEALSRANELKDLFNRFAEIAGHACEASAK